MAESLVEGCGLECSELQFDPLLRFYGKAIWFQWSTKLRSQQRPDMCFLLSAAESSLSYLHGGHRVFKRTPFLSPRRTKGTGRLGFIWEDEKGVSQN